MQFDKVIGHRGASGYAPENTRASMFKAYQLGIRWVEFDVVLTADNIPVVIHDETLERTTNGRGEIGKKRYQDLEYLDAGSWFSPEYAGERIPRMQNLIHYLNQLDLAMNIEIKPSEGQEDLMASLIAAELLTLSPLQRSRILISSFSENVLRAMRLYDSKIALGFLIHQWDLHWLPIVRELQCVSLHTNQRILTANRVKLVKNENKKLLCYTVNSRARAKTLFQWGVDAVFSDFPDKILL